MSPPKLPPHGLFIKYGKLEAAAHGRIAVVGLLLLIGLGSVIALRVFGFI